MVLRAASPNTVSHSIKHTLGRCSFLCQQIWATPLTGLLLPPLLDYCKETRSLPTSSPPIEVLAIFIANSHPYYVLTQSSPQCIMRRPHHNPGSGSTTLRLTGRNLSKMVRGMEPGLEVRSVNAMPKPLHHLALYTFLKGSLSLKALPNGYITLQKWRAGTILCSILCPLQHLHRLAHIMGAHYVPVKFTWRTIHHKMSRSWQ